MDLPATITYEGRRQDLPGFLPWFKLPVPKAFFDSIFKERRKGKMPIYTDDAYLFGPGDTVYDCPEAYGAWGEALGTLQFIAQIQSVSGQREPQFEMILNVYEPTPDRRAVEETRQIQTTQDQFLQFLKSGQLEDL